jgi:hypothetical protein
MRNASVTVVALLLALAACDKADEPEAATGAPASAAPAAGTSRGGGDAVPAVKVSQGEPVATVGFIIDSRPVAGQPFALKLQVSAAVPVPELQLAAESTDLIIAPASTTLALGTANTPVEQELMVTAPKAGLLDLTLRLKGADAAETVYAVPVLVAAAAAP